MGGAALVLIVDDEPSIRLMFRTALQAAGYDTAEAGDGPTALARLRESSPDVMLLDLKMPGMDGMETLRRMREAGDDTAVVIVTAHGSIPDAVAAMKLGAVDFLTKPVTPEGLRKVVSEVVLRHGKSEPKTAIHPEHRAPARRRVGARPGTARLAGHGRRGSDSARDRSGPGEAVHQQARFRRGRAATGRRARPGTRFSRRPHPDGSAPRVPGPDSCGLSVLPHGPLVRSGLHPGPGQPEALLRAVWTRFPQQGHQSRRD